MMTHIDAETIMKWRGDKATAMENIDHLLDAATRLDERANMIADLESKLAAAEERADIGHKMVCEMDATCKTLRAKLAECERERDGFEAHRNGLYRVFRWLAEDDRKHLAMVDEMIQADVDAIVCERIDAKAKRDAARAESARLRDALAEIARRSENPRAKFPEGVAFPMHCLEGINKHATTALAAIAPKASRPRFTIFTDPRCAACAEPVGCSRGHRDGVMEGWPDHHGTVACAGCEKLRNAVLPAFYDMLGKPRTDLCNGAYCDGAYVADQCTCWVSDARAALKASEINDDQTSDPNVR